MKNPFKWRGWFTGRDPREAERISRLQAITACVNQANAILGIGEDTRVKSLKGIKQYAQSLFVKAGHEPMTEEEFWREQDRIMGRTHSGDQS